MKNNKQNKQAKVFNAKHTSRSDPKLRRVIDEQLQTVQKTMEQMVAPDYHAPQVFPAVAPGRAGAARFPLVLEFAAGGGLNSFGVICKPSLIDPVAVTKIGVPAYSSTLTYQLDYLFEQKKSKGGTAQCLESGALESVLAGEITQFNTSVIWVPIDGSAAAPPVLAASWRLQGQSVWAFGDFDLVVQDSAGTITSLVTVSLSYDTSSATTLGLSLPTTATHIGIRQLSGSDSDARIGVNIRTTTGQIRCGPSSAQNIMEIFRPDWDNLLSNSLRYRVVAMDCTLTYTGSALENAGSVAVANTDSAFQPKEASGSCSFYRAINERAFDRYSGRLAPSGGEEGGAHWFYAPDDLDHLTLRSFRDDDELDIPSGIFGVEGMGDEGRFILQVNIVLNFYSESPEYVMKIQPPMALYNIGLSLVRRHIPIVSSNDSHVKKLKAAAKGGANILGRAAREGFKYVRDNPEQFAQAALMLL